MQSVTKKYRLHQVLFGAGYGNRTRLTWLGTRSSTDELILQNIYLACQIA